MPSLVEMPTINTTLGGKPLVVPGGWHARVPEIQSVDTESREALVGYFQASGLLPLKAEEAAERTVQKTLETAYKKHHGDAVRRYAKIYARRYPHLWDRESGLLRGFIPEVMARQCQPWEQVTEKRRRIIRQRMAEMALKAREGLHAEV